MASLPGWNSLDAVSRYHSWLEISGIVVLVVLAFAETMTFVYGQRKDDLTVQQQAATDRNHQLEIARLHRETAQLARDAEAAKAQIADAHARAAEANEKAEHERLERMKIEARLAPRSLAGERLEKFVQTMVALRGTTFGILISESTPESVRIANSVASALSAAGWTPAGTETVSQGVALEGILVDAEPEAQNAARRLVEALNTADIAATFQPGTYRLVSQNAGMKLGVLGPAAGVKILVGAKP
ncbi:MAG TPA: hypothetical protein VME47_01340 [Acetobacteraceae bacterium]|nr:hypothetical protein [Acetobacteraceae bacterium]